MRLIYIVHPWGADPAANAILLRSICADVMAAGDIPICPPLYFCWLDDSLTIDRQEGMRAALELLRRCDLVQVYAEPTEGMKAELAAARTAGIPVSWAADLDTAGEWTAKEG